MLTGGWKAVSMVDVHGKVTFTLWLCGCNLKCPFCHNWRIAEGKGCFELERGAMLEELEVNSFLIDYFHVTGGEPLMQWTELSSLLASVKALDVPVSLNTNLTLVGPLEKLLNAGLVDHIATDLKAPPAALYGLPEEASERLWRLFLRGLELVSNYGLPLELRIPVPKGFDVWPWIEEGLGHLDTEFYVVLNPLVGKPLTNPRDEAWCSAHCWPEDEVRNLGERLDELGIEFHVNRWA
ncbi:anaerobic ribonucleoside-triphosphate reductase activating protein [Thermococcus sp. GR7]|uniref:anaerobic ribonucleoside-triphosphate reductase activating protein n=1 Tax=unclassified Thermococcus TaxID=2627626 RepID=UPI00142F9259|nr:MULTISPECIES: anaerobic ribonucleoside-triphosphate reductase activating protein [unclassified Thermococcus]NJE45897.1 anaerobic ribonucleoside-triphosphate reductase activating protein [Thermococcus sp. GR7]NJE78788.1 anaerobic ribonucleoside-triphosphate reductase activating protein [Thermococcus sp. GR4]NJF22092.1 anaerobic ribonucleoside-triphosphate reductase activating protein [Thermococcus sp. GR5]